MVMKKIIAFIICLALCVTGLAVGVMNQQAENDATIVGLADETIDEDVDSVSNSAIIIGAKNPGAIDGTPKVTSDEPGIIKQDDNYYLVADETGHYTLPSYEDAGFVALKEALEDSTRTTQVIFDGQGNTLTVPKNAARGLFDIISNCTIQNLTIASDETGIVTSHYHNFNPINDNNKATGILAVASYNEIVIDNVLITANFTYNGTSSIVAGLGGFIGTNKTGTIKITDSEFAGTINAKVQCRIGGIVGVTSGGLTVSNCTMSGTINAGKDTAGGIASHAGGTVPVTITNTLFTGRIKAPYGSYHAGLVGYAMPSGGKEKGLFTVNNCKVGGEIELLGTDDCGMGGLFGNIYAYDDNEVFDIQNIEISTELIDNTTGESNVIQIGGISACAQSKRTFSYPITFKNLLVKPTITTNSATTGQSSMATGIAWGYKVAHNFTFESCTFEGTLTQTASGKFYIGGAFGAYYNGAQTINVNKCTFNDTIIAKSAATVGGVVGYSSVDTYEQKLNVTNSIIASDLYCEGVAVGGVVGNATNTFTLTMNNVIVAASLSGAETTAKSAIMKRAGITSASFTNCYVADGVLNDLVLSDSAVTVTGVETVSFTTSDDTAEYGMFCAELDPAIYAIVKSIETAKGESAEFGAIITLDSYIAKKEIEFTHESLNAFYNKYAEEITEKNAAVTRLYVETDAVDLTDEDIRDDIYKVGIKLGNPNGTGYTARAYIKIGDLYIYSK